MLFYYSVLYLAPSLLFSTVVVLATWRRAQWWLLDFLVIPLPGAVWMLFLNEGLRQKSFSNLMELLVLSVVLAGLFAVRGWAGTRLPRAVSSVLLMIASLAIATAIFYVVPLIPD